MVGDTSDDVWMVNITGSRDCHSTAPPRNRHATLSVSNAFSWGLTLWFGLVWLITEARLELYSFLLVDGISDVVGMVNITG